MGRHNTKETIKWLSAHGPLCYYYYECNFRPGDSPKAILALYALYMILQHFMQHHTDYPYTS